MNAISVNKLSKTFRYHKKAEGLWGSVKAMFHREWLTKEAVKDASFQISKGEFVGFLGPNGAGKTTTLKMLSGILYPTSGTARVLGFDPSKRQDQFKMKIAMVAGQKSQLWITLPPIETFRLLQKIYRVPENVFQKRLSEMADMFEVSEILNVQVRKLSLGQRMKCELIASLLHKPEVLFLDEPTIGLDVVSQKKVREFLKAVNEKDKTTIILTSHNMDDVQDLCKRVIIINQGRLGYDGLIDHLIHEYSQDKTVSLQFEKGVARGELERFGKVRAKDQYEAEIVMPASETPGRIAEIVSRFPVKDIGISSVTLEEVVADVFSRK